MRILFALLVLTTYLYTGAGLAEEPRQTIRLFANDGGDKRYLNGFDWMQFDIEQKIDLIEQARRGALQLSAVMTLPAELYIANLDSMFNANANVRHIDLGQAIQGIAISLKDWNDGTDPDTRIKEALGDSPKTAS